MAKSNKVLTVDITNESITIIEATPSDKKQTVVHNALIFETPEDSYEDGNIKDVDKIAMAIREQLDANGITNKNVIFVLTSTRVYYREVVVPNVKPNRIKGMIAQNAADYFPVNNIEDYIVSHSVLESFTDENNVKSLKLMVVAAPITMVKAYYELGGMLGLTVQSIDYIGNAMLQLIKTQTSSTLTTMVIQLGSESTILNIVKGDTLLLQRTIPYGTNAAVNEVMEEQGVDATTAMTLLQNERIISVDFDDNAATGAFRYLINNIGRVIDYYVSKNPDKPIDDVYLVGDGALIRGIDGLFKIQLGIQTKVMDSLYAISFDKKIDTKIYNPVYLVVAIGASFAPMGFEPYESKTKRSSSSSGDALKYTVIGSSVLVLAAVAAFGVTATKKSKAESQRDSLNQQIAAIQDIEQIMNEYEAAKAKYVDISSMYAQTRTLNENFNQLIVELEERTPKDIIVNSWSSADNGVTVAASAKNYAAIAKYVIELKKIECISNARVDAISQVKDEQTGESVYVFNAICLFVDMTEEEKPVVEDDAETTDSTDSLESADTTEAAE